MNQQRYAKIGTLTQTYAKKKPISFRDTTIEQQQERRERHNAGMAKFVPLFKRAFYQHLSKSDLPSSDTLVIKSCLAEVEKQLSHQHMHNPSLFSPPEFEANPKVQEILKLKTKPELEKLRKKIDQEMNHLDIIVKDHVYTTEREEGGWAHYYGRSAYALYNYLYWLSKNITERMRATQ